jgi:hypothetical protein
VARDVVSPEEMLMSVGGPEPMLAMATTLAAPPAGDCAVVATPPLAYCAELCAEAWPEFPLPPPRPPAPPVAFADADKRPEPLLLALLLAVAAPPPIPPEPPNAVASDATGAEPTPVAEVVELATPPR